MKAQLQLVEVEAVARCNDDLAVEHAGLRQRGNQRLVELGKIAIERPEIPALDIDVVAAAKHNRPEAIPLRLVQHIVARWQSRRELRQHRRDWRVDWEGRV